MKTMTLTAKEKQAVFYAVGLLTTDLYFVRYFEIVANEPTATEAHQIIEKELFDLCGQNRYTDYNSFREMRRRYVLKLSLRSKLAR